MFEQRRLGMAWHDNDLVFCTAIGTPLEQGNVHRRHWKPATRKAGIPHYRLHDLRHSVCTHLIMAGTNIDTDSDMMGHSTASFTLDRYSHVIPSTKREAVSVLEGLYARQAGTV